MLGVGRWWWSDDRVRRVGIGWYPTFSAYRVKV